MLDVTQPADQSRCRFESGEIAQFERDGFVIVRGLGGADFRQRMLQAAFEGLAHESGPLEYEAELQYPGAPQSLAANGGRTVRRLKQAHSRGFVFTEWVSDPALVGRMEQLIGSEVVLPLAHHNCIMTKQPRFSSETGWHQDIRYWSYQRPELVSVWLALSHEHPRNGCLKLIPGTHRMSFVRDRLDSAQFLRPEHPENCPLIEQAVHAELEPGDVLFFHCRTLHAAERNLTDETKFSVVFTFRSAGNAPQRGSRSASLPELHLPPFSAYAR